MVVRLVIAADRPFRNVPGREAAGHPIAGELAAGDLLLEVFYELLAHVGDEVRVPDAGVVAAGDNPGVGAVEVVFAAIVLLHEIVVAIEHELELICRHLLKSAAEESVEHSRRGGDSKVEHGLATNVD